jgi:hypothetical protein
MQLRFYLSRNERLAMFCTEDEVNEVRRQGLRHVFVLAFFLFRAFSALIWKEYTFLGRLAQAHTFPVVT